MFGWDSAALCKELKERCCPRISLFVSLSLQLPSKVPAAKSRFFSGDLLVNPMEKLKSFYTNRWLIHFVAAIWLQAMTGVCSSKTIAATII
jgi:hypothetical protein